MQVTGLRESRNQARRSEPFNHLFANLLARTTLTQSLSYLTVSWRLLEFPKMAVLVARTSKQDIG
jgi:hypothetical protein